MFVKKPEPPTRWCCFMIVVMLFVGGLTNGNCNATVTSTEVRVGSELDFPPYAFADESGHPTGFSVELIKAVTDAMGLSIKISTGSWDTVWNALVAGQLDVLPIVAKLPERKRMVDFSLPHTETYDAFFVRKEDHPLQNITAAREKEIVVMRSDAAHHELLKRNFQGNLILVDTIPEGLKLISSGKHNAFLCSKLIGTIILKKHGLTGIAVGPAIPDYKRAFSFAVKKGDTELLEKLNQGLLIVKTNGEYDRIYNNWLSFDDPWQKVQKYLLPIIIVVIAFAMIAGVWLVMLQLIVRRHTCELAEKNKMLFHAYDKLEVRIQERTADLAQSNQLLQTEITERKQVEESLKQTTEEMNWLFKSMINAFVIFESIFDDNGYFVSYRFVYINDAYESIAGVKNDEVRGKTVHEVWPKTEPEWIKKYGEVAVTGISQTFDMYHNPTRKHYHCKVYRPWNTMDRFCVIFEDITERKRSEEALKEREEKYRNLFNNAEVGIFRSRLDGSEVLEVNSRFLEIVGMTPEETLGKPSVNLWVDPKEREEMVKRLVADGSVSQFEYRMLNKRQGGVRNCLTSLRLYRESGIVEGSILDITERKRAEEAIQDARAFSENLIETANVMVIGLNTKGEVTVFNNAAEKISGYTRTELEHRNWFEVIVPKTRYPGVWKEFSRLMEGGLPKAFENPIITKSGEERYIIWSNNEVSEKGRITGTISFGLDITERKQAENDLRQTVNRLDLAQTSAKMGIWDWDIVTGHIKWTDQLFNLFGLDQTKTTASFEAWREVLHPDDLEMAGLRIDRALKEKKKLYSDYRVVLPDGQIRWINSVGEAQYDDQGQAIHMIGMCMDITERKHAEEALRISKEQFRLLSEATYEAIAIHEKGVLLLANDQYFKMFGYGPGEALGKEMMSLTIAPESIELAKKQVATDSLETYELIGLRKDGTRFPIEARVRKMEYKGRHVRFGAIRDITERKQVEEKIKASLLEKETLLKEIHHRVKNNLQVISSLLNLQSAYLQDERAEEALRESIERLETMTFIHTQLYESQDLTRVDFGSSIRDLIGNISRSSGRTESPVEINIDAGEISLGIDNSIPCGLILNELISNALKHAFPDGKEGKINIEMRLEDNQVVLTVQDNGIGFPDSIDFTNVKSLGLDLVNILVRQMNGKIDMRVDGGTRWTITFTVKSEREWRNG